MKTKPPKLQDVVLTNGLRTKYDNPRQVLPGDDLKTGRKDLAKPFRSPLQRDIAARPQFLAAEADTNDCRVLLRWDGNVQCIDDSRADQVGHFASGVEFHHEFFVLCFGGLCNLNYLEEGDAKGPARISAHWLFVQGENFEPPR
jgi:hypothetical protein